MADFDPHVLMKRTLDESDKMAGQQGAAYVQGLLVIAAAGFSIASALRDLALAVRAGAK